MAEEIMRSSVLQMGSVNEQARQIVEDLPESCAWEDLMYRIYVRQAIEAGLADSAQGRTTTVEDVRGEFGLPH